ncbi:pentatricopeptide repeat-containing protein [Canna indica]|uniref:Pentatricopeptide repeat-containing protein n=1 Tax=Canna indica TaxID=4628 RepID=A0AAQ3Q793_9LILI|nr:pentatricopeptide repeat-containing protein [Canna indica]
MPCLELLLQYLHNHPCKLPQIHALLITSGFLQSPPRRLIPMWQGSSPTFSYNCLIRACLRRRDPPDASLRIFAQMLAHGVRPNRHTFPSLFKAVATTDSSPSTGRSVHSQALRRGIILDDFTNCSIVDFYSRVGDLSSARKTFDEMIQPDLASGNSMLHALCLHGDLASALVFFESMVDRDVISWTSLISGYARNGRFDEAIGLFRRWIMQKGLPLRPNEAMLVSVLSACANLDDFRALFYGLEIHGYIVRNEAPLTAFLGTALVDMYSKHGYLGYCTNVFEATVEKEVCTWNAMMSALAGNGKAAEALHLFDQMRVAGLQPNHITFVALLTACARQKLVDLGLKWFKLMTSEFGLVPLMEHYGCVVDLLAKAGFIKEAIQFIRRMPLQADASVLGALLGACKVHENAQVGDDVGKQLISLQPWHSGRYMILRNIYAASGRWDDAAGIKNAMEKLSIKKPTGHSWVVYGKYGLRQH